MQDTALMLHTLLELGESMLADRADVRRVEQTLTRMGLAYGAVRMDVFVITSSIVLTMCFPDETSVTQTRRIEKICCDGLWKAGGHQRYQPQLL